MNDNRRETFDMQLEINEEIAKTKTTLMMIVNIYWLGQIGFLMAKKVHFLSKFWGLRSKFIEFWTFFMLMGQNIRKKFGFWLKFVRILGFKVKIYRILNFFLCYWVKIFVKNWGFGQILSKFWFLMPKWVVFLNLFVLLRQN